MAIFTERDGLGILSAALDPDFDPLSITQVNGDPGLVDVDIPLSIGGTVKVQANGMVTLNDATLTWPQPGNSLADSLIAQVSDGLNMVDVAVNLQIHVPL